MEIQLTVPDHSKMYAATKNLYFFSVDDFANFLRRYESNKPGLVPDIRLDEIRNVTITPATQASK